MRASASSRVSSTRSSATLRLARLPPIARAQPLPAASAQRSARSTPLNPIRAIAVTTLVTHNAAQPRRRAAAVRANAVRANADAASAAAENAAGDPLPAGAVSVILLSGGSGKRMGAAVPKQYLDLRGRPIALHSAATFAAMPEVGEIVVVCDPAWREIFAPLAADLRARGKRHAWALPGTERQDSVASGLAQVSSGAGLVAVHDAARPLVRAADAANCMRDGWRAGAAVLAVPCKQTVKEVDPATGFVARTLDRARLWEVQTPQCVRPELLRRGFRHAEERGLAVTDDASVVEALGEPVRVTRGCYTNIKVTTPEDMGVAEGFVDEREAREGPGQKGAAAGAATGAAAAAAAAA